MFKKFKSSKFWEVVITRFAKAFISGFVSTLGLITISNVSTWQDLQLILSSIFLSGVVGGINGVIMALEKGYRFEI